MNRTMVVVLLLLAVLFSSSADWINLDFESYSGSGGDVLPGWTRGPGDYAWPLVDVYPLSTAGLGIVTTNGDMPAISGQYSLFMSPGYSVSGPPGGIVTVAIWQSNLVLSTSAYLGLTINTTNELSNYTFTLGNINLLASPPVVLPSGDYRFTADIQALAGQTSTLYLAMSGNWFSPWLIIDDVEFQAIPEPSTIALLAVGALLSIRRLLRFVCND